MSFGDNSNFKTTTNITIVVILVVAIKKTFRKSTLFYDMYSIPS